MRQSTTNGTNDLFNITEIGCRISSCDWNVMMVKLSYQNKERYSRSRNWQSRFGPNRDEYRHWYLLWIAICVKWCIPGHFAIFSKQTFWIWCILMAFSQFLMHFVAYLHVPNMVCNFIILLLYSSGLLVLVLKLIKLWCTPDLNVIMLWK